jgi:hypothetical protein
VSIDVKISGSRNITMEESIARAVTSGQEGSSNGNDDCCAISPQLKGRVVLSIAVSEVSDQYHWPNTWTYYNFQTFF